MYHQYFPTLKVMLTFVVAFISISTSTASISIEAEKKTLLNVLGLKKVPNIPSDREKIQIPDHIKELYEQKTGLEVDTTNFRLPGQHVGSANTARYYPGKQVGAFFYVKKKIKKHSIFIIYFLFKLQNCS